jgi:hypothetical protein
MSSGDEKNGKPIPPSGNGGRDFHGRFAKGHPGGPGRKAGASMLRMARRLHKALLAEVSFDDLRAIIKSMKDKAKAGDAVAARLIFERMAGPLPPIELAREVAELRQLIEEGFDNGHE